MVFGGDWTVADETEVNPFCRQERKVHMKKTIAIMAILAMMVNSVCAASLAAETNASSSAMLIHSGDGIYTEATGLHKIGAIRVEAEPKYENIYSSDDGQYYFNTKSSEFVKVQLQTKKLVEYDTYLQLKAAGLPQEILDDIAAKAAWAVHCGNTDASVQFFVQEGTLQTEGAEERSGDFISTTPTLIPYTTTQWNGYTFEHYQIYFPYIELFWKQIYGEDSITEMLLESIDAAIVQFAGTHPVYGEAIGWLSFNQSLYDIWQGEYPGGVLVADSGNAIHVHFQYALTAKYTYYVDPFVPSLKQLGCSSQKCEFEIAELRLRFETEEGLYIKTLSAAPTCTTPNYNNPEAIAYQYQIPGWVERVAISLPNHYTYEVYPPYFEWPSTWP